MVLITYLNYTFVLLTSNITSVNNYSGLADIFNINNNLFLITILLLVFLSFSYSVNKIIKKNDYYILIFVSFILSLFLIIYKSGFDISLIYYSLFYFLLNIFYILYLNYSFKKNILHNYLTYFFIMVLFSFLFINFLFFFDSNLDKNSNNFNQIIFNNNLIVLNILNDNSKNIIAPYMNKSYTTGYSSGYLNSCLDNSVKNCNYTSDKLDVALYNKQFNSNNFILFDKSKYTSKLIEAIDEKLPINIIKYFYLFYASLVLMLLSFFTPLVMLLLNFISFKFVKFFSWFFDPFGVE